MNQVIKMAVLSCLAPMVLLGCQSAAPSNPVVYALNYAAGTQQNQVVAAGSNTTVAVTVSSNSGVALGGLVLSASVNNGYCSLVSSTATTDSNGNASFGVIAGSGSSLACTVSVSLPSIAASRATINFGLNIRAIQRVLTAPVTTVDVPTLPLPTTISLATTTAQMTLLSPHAALGSANDSVNVRIGNLPPLPNNFTYVLWATNAASVTTGLDAFKNTTNSVLSVGFNATPPVNTGSSSPVTPVDNRANFTRVFVSIEAGAAIPVVPSALIVLDTGSSLFVQGK